MKRFALIIFSMFIIQQTVFADVLVFSDNNKFGLKNEQGVVVVNAKYKKLVRLGESAWIMQDGTKYGVINDDGDVLVKAEYNQAERILGKFAKLRKGSKYGIADEDGIFIIEPEYSSIDLLPGGLFITAINHKYGLYSTDGDIVLDNIFDDIYVKDRKTLVLVYGHEKFEFEQSETDAGFPYEIVFPHLLEGADMEASDLVTSPMASTGYYSVTFTDYILKLFSSISPAYEQTIDELMFSHGADTVSVLIKFSWLPKFPFVYAKNYCKTVANPTNGPLNSVKQNIKNKIKN